MSIKEMEKYRNIKSYFCVVNENKNFQSDLLLNIFHMVCGNKLLHYILLNNKHIYMYISQEYNKNKFYYIKYFPGMLWEWNFNVHWRFFYNIDINK